MLINCIKLKYIILCRVQNIGDILIRILMEIIQKILAKDLLVYLIILMRPLYGQVMERFIFIKVQNSGNLIHHKDHQLKVHTQNLYRIGKVYLIMLMLP
jgi:hypothetical protein